MRTDRDRRRSTGPWDPRDPRDPRPACLARDLLQVIQETVFARKFDEKRCPLVKQESDLSSEEGNDRIANLIDFFFTIVKSQNNERKNSTGSCFKTDSPTETTSLLKPKKVNTELERKMETLMDFLATTGCMDDDTKDDTKITLMEFLFGGDSKPLVEINHDNKQMSLSESNINVKLSYIDESPVEESRELLVDILIKYMENYEEPTISMSVTPCLSEKSKSDVTISKIETFSDISKTKSDSTLTQTQDTVIERESDRRISETVVDLSNIKQDLEEIFDIAVAKVNILRNIEVEDDTMSETEDLDNFTAYTKPPVLYNIYSVELSDILEEDENDPSSRVQEDRMTVIREIAEDLIDFIEDKLQSQFESDSSGDEFDIGASMPSSISLIDLRCIPDLPPSIIRPIVVKVDKSTSTDNDSVSNVSRRIDSACMTEDTSLSSTERQERVLDKLESLHKFFSRSRLEIISESEEEKHDRRLHQVKEDSSELKAGQASLDDVEDIKDEVFTDNNENFIENDASKDRDDKTDDGEINDETRNIIVSMASNSNIDENVSYEKTTNSSNAYQNLSESDDNILDNVDEIDKNYPVVIDPNETNNQIQPNSNTDLLICKVSETDIHDSYITESNPDFSELKVNIFLNSDSNKDSFNIATDNESKDLNNLNHECQKTAKDSHYKLKLENERQGNDISENDYTEIDKIIDDAVIIVINKLDENLKRYK